MKSSETLTKAVGYRSAYKAALAEATKHEELFRQKVFGLMAKRELDTDSGVYLLAEFQSAVTANRMVIHCIYSEENYA